MTIRQILATTIAAAAFTLCTPTTHAEVPGLLNYQGKVTVGTTPFTGTGSFKFALVSGDGATTYWSNDGSSFEGSEPGSAISRDVVRGIYAVLLGDDSLPGMVAVPKEVFANGDVRLRVWFDDGVNGSQLLSPDQRLAAVGYAMTAATVADGAITAASLAPGALSNIEVGPNLTLNGVTTVAGTLDLPYTVGTSAGVITVSGQPFMHTDINGNFFGGTNAGNFTMRGGANVAIGETAFQSNYFGSADTAVGFGSLFSNTNGGGNTALGFYTLNANTTGASNTAVGSSALQRNTTAEGNTAVGESVLTSNTTGEQNTAIGYAAMSSNMTGGYNVAYGPYALLQNTDGYQNLALGYAAGYNTTGSNNIIIGHEGVAGESDIIRIGNGQTDTYLAGVIHGDGSGLTGIAATSLAPNSITATQLASGLTLAGTTTGTFSGPLTGNADTATTAGSAVSFTGSLAGDVVGTQTATMVGSIGGKSAGAVAAAVNAVFGATSNSTAGALVLRDGSGNFNVGTISVAGGLSLPTTSSASVGVITQNGVRLLHTYGDIRNTFVGLSAGNFTTTGISDTAVGNNALTALTTGIQNTAVGYSALLSTSTGGNNTAVGNSALLSNTFGISNTSVGTSALASNTGGNYSTAVGVNALSSSTVSNLTAVGAFALLANTTGTLNTAVGYRALAGNTTGFGNTAVGNSALSTQGAGVSFNTAVGASALSANTTGLPNTALGYGTLGANTTGGDNTAAGHLSLSTITTSSNSTGFGSRALQFATGGQNTALGSNALASLTDGTDNIAVGYAAGSNLVAGASNNILIGNRGVGGESSTIRIGTSGTQTKAFIAGIRGVTTGVADAVQVVIDSNGQLGTISSSRRYKEDIADMGDASERLQSLRPVTFHYTQPYADGSKPVQYGLIAEEVAEVFPELAVRNAEGKPETVKYQDLAPLLLNEVQKLRKEKEEMAARLEKLEAAVSAMGSK